MVVGALRSTRCVLLLCILQEPSSNLCFLVGGLFNSLIRLDGCSVGTILLGRTGIVLFCFLQELSFNLRFLVGGFFNSLARLDGCNGTILLGSITLSEAVIL